MPEEDSVQKEKRPRKRKEPGKTIAVWKVLVLISLVTGISIVGGMLIPRTPSVSFIPKVLTTRVVMDSSRCSVYYDSTTLTPADARLVGRVLEGIGYFTREGKTIGAILTKDGKTCTITLVGDRSISKEIINSFKYNLQQTLTTYRTTHPDRKYRYQILLIDSEKVNEEIFVE